MQEFHFYCLTLQFSVFFSLERLALKASLNSHLELLKNLKLTELSVV